MADDPLMKDDVFTHAHAYSTSSKTELVALCDTDEKKLRTAGTRWNVTALFDNPREMMTEAAPELVSICTPTHTHLAIAREILSAEKLPLGILCEKPLASTIDQAQELVNLAAEKRVVLATIYMRRYAENFRALKLLLDSGDLGRVRAVSGWYPGGTFHNGTHWFDMFRWLIGEAESVDGLNSLGETGDDPTLDVAIRDKDGLLATLRACDARNFTLFEMDIVLDRGRVQIMDSGHEIAVSRARPSPRYTGYTELQPSGLNLGHRRNLLLNAVEDIADAVTLHRAPACTGADGLAAMRIADAAAQSVKDGHNVKIS
jgi:predicted dehydrogenase